MNANGVTFYRGPSLLTGDPIVAVATGLIDRSQNAKTGDMVQTWILCQDFAPMAAIRSNVDEAICGDCALRGRDSFDRRCYVPVWLAPNNVYKALDTYARVSWPELEAALAGRSVRLGAYGDPAALPFEVWQVALRRVAGWTGYTHQWRGCDPRFRTILMASVESAADFRQAQRQGWRTFRLLQPGDQLIAGAEIVCPASAEAGHRTTCDRCELCRGGAVQARSITIRPLGHNGVMAAFHRSRHAALSSHRRPHGKRTAAIPV